MSESERFIWACANRYSYVLGRRTAQGEAKAVRYADTSLDRDGTAYASYKLAIETLKKWVITKKGKHKCTK